MPTTVGRKDSKWGPPMSEEEQFVPTFVKDEGVVSLGGVQEGPFNMPRGMVWYVRTVLCNGDPTRHTPRLAEDSTFAPHERLMWELYQHPTVCNV